MITRSDVVNKAREYLGTKYAHQGRLKGVGIDCAGLLLCVGKELEIVPQDFEFVSYNRMNDGRELKRIVEIFADETTDPHYADICIINVMGNPQHCGFLSDKGMIHVLDSAVEHRIDEKWSKRIVATYKLKDVIDG